MGSQVRRWAGAGLAATVGLAALLLPVATAQAAPDPLSLPRGPDTLVPWYERNTRTVHFGTRVLRSPTAPVLDIHNTSTGVLLRGRDRLVALTRAGRVQVVARTTKPTAWGEQIRTGSWAGRQVAFEVDRAGKHYLVVRRVADGSLVRRARFARPIQVLGFHDGRVWYRDRTRELTFNVANGRTRRAPVAIPSAAREHISLSTNLLALTPRAGTALVRVRPLLEPWFRAWSRADYKVLSSGPDGRYLVVATLYDDVFDSRTTLRIRDSRTGALVRTLPGYYADGNIAWEDNETVLLPALHWDDDAELEDAEIVTVRTHIETGAQERVGAGTSGDLNRGYRVMFTPYW